MTRPSGLAIYAFLYLAFLYLPVLFLPLFSFNDGTIVAFPIKGWTLEWYRQLGRARNADPGIVEQPYRGVCGCLVGNVHGAFCGACLC